MIESYSIGVTAKLMDLVSPALDRMIRTFETTDKAAEQLNRTLNRISRQTKGMRLLQSHLFGVERGFARATKAAEGFGGAAGAATRASYAMDTMAVSSGRMARNMAAARLHAQGIRDEMGSGGGAMSAAGGAAAARGNMALLGAAAAGYAGYASYKSARDYEAALAQFKSLNMGSAANAQAIGLAASLKQPGVSQTETLSLLRDAVQTMGDMGHAKMILPTIARMKYMNASLFKGGATGINLDDRQYQDLMRVAEIRGAWKNPGEAFKQLDMAQRVITGTGGRVLPRDQLLMLKTGGVAAQKLNDLAFYYKMEPMVQELGGMRVGTGLMSAYQNLAMGRTTTAAAQELVRLGLVTKPGVVYNKIGMVKKILPDSLVQQTLFESDPMDWLMRVAIPAMRAKGITSDEKILGELSYILTNRTGSSLFSKMYLQRDKIGKNTRINANAMGILAGEKLANSTPRGQEEQLHAAWTDFKKTLGDPAMPMVIKAMHGLTDGMKYLGSLDWDRGSGFYWAAKAFADRMNGLFSLMNKYSVNNMLTQNPVAQLGGKILGAEYGAAGRFLYRHFGPTHPVPTAERFPRLGGQVTQMPRAGASSQPIVVQMHVNQHKLAEALISVKNLHGSTDTNFSAYRPSPALTR